MMSVTGTDGSPSAPRPGMGDHPTSMSLFGAIMLGLYQRERTGRGSRVTTSLLASGAWANACDIQAKLLEREISAAWRGQASARPAHGRVPEPRRQIISARADRSGQRISAPVSRLRTARTRLGRVVPRPTTAADRNAAALYPQSCNPQFESRDLADLLADDLQTQRHQMGAAARARRGREGSADACRRGVHQDGLSRRWRARRR